MSGELTVFTVDTSFGVSINKVRAHSYECKGNTATFYVDVGEERIKVAKYYKVTNIEICTEEEEILFGENNIFKSMN